MGAILVTAGCLALRGSEQANLVRIGRYNDAVSAWITGGALSEFEELSFSLIVSSNETKQLAQVRSAGNAKSGLLFSTYNDTVVFSVPAGSETYSLSPNGPSMGANLTMRVRLDGSDSIAFESVPAYRIVSRGRTIDRCIGICVQFSSTYGFTSVSPCFGESAGIYERIQFVNHFSVAWNATVASSGDPAVVAADLTGGTLQFTGYSSLGLSLVGVGGGLLVFLTIVALGLYARLDRVVIVIAVAIVAHILSLGAGLMLEDHCEFNHLLSRGI